MINIDEINQEIKKLENCDCMSWSICEKLATLYIIRKYFNESNEDTKSMMSIGMK